MRLSRACVRPVHVKEVSNTDPVYSFLILLAPSQDYDEFAFNALADAFVSAGGAGCIASSAYPNCYDSVLFPSSESDPLFSSSSCYHGLAFGTRLAYAAVNNLANTDSAFILGLSPARINRNDGSHCELFHRLYDSFGGASLTGALSNTGPDDLNKRIGVRIGRMDNRFPVFMLSADSPSTFRDFFAQILNYRDRQGKRHFVMNNCKWNPSLLPTKDKNRECAVKLAMNINKLFNKGHITFDRPTAPITTQAQHEALCRTPDLVFYFPVYEGFDCWHPAPSSLSLLTQFKRLPPLTRERYDQIHMEEEPFDFSSLQT